MVEVILLLRKRKMKSEEEEEEEDEVSRVSMGIWIVKKMRVRSLHWAPQ